MKTCSRCKQEKPLDAFYSDPRNTSTGKTSACCDCIKARVTKWQKDNPDKENRKHGRYRNSAKGQDYHRRYNLRRKYGLEIHEYDALVVEQKGQCAICSREAKLVVDHCHRTGQVRALLCNECNRGLGFLRDDPSVLSAALNYLQKHSAHGRIDDE